MWYALLSKAMLRFRENPNERVVNIVVKSFNTAGVCTPDKHYMVDLTDRVKQIKRMVDAGRYFTINRARQYGKTTTLAALAHTLQPSYVVVDLDFQDIGDAGFADENNFSRSFATIFSDAVLTQHHDVDESFVSKTEFLAQYADESEKPISLLQLFRKLQQICSASSKPVVLMIDEVDSATNNQVFLDFLAQLRSLYLKREIGKNVSTFYSVILAGVTDVKNLKHKIHPDEANKFNSPWNIAAAFTVDMSLSVPGISGMLGEYEADHHTGMDIERIAQLLFDYTSGYPFLVSRLCQIMDQDLKGNRFPNLTQVWTVEGISEAFKQILMEQNTLFESLMAKVYSNKPLSDVLQRILFGGERIPYNPDNIPSMDGEMYGFIKNDNGALAVTNRIFESRLYNYFLSLNEMKDSPISKAASNGREQFIVNGRLNMEKLMSRYVRAFDDIYEGKSEAFSEDEGRRRFLLFIRPVINGTGNYYIEAGTRNNERMDLVIDYLGERFVVELKIWHGKAYHEKGEKQLTAYLDYCHLDKGYLLTYSFNKRKTTGQKTITVGGKTIVETFV